MQVDLQLRINLKLNWNVPGHPWACSCWPDNIIIYHGIPLPTLQRLISVDYYKFFVGPEILFTTKRRAAAARHRKR